MTNSKYKLTLADKASEKSLGKLLVEGNYITSAQLEEARETQHQQGGMLIDILAESGMVKPEDLAIVRSIHLNIPLIDLKRHSVQEEALKLIPEEMARKHMLIPLDIVNGSLMIVMADPEDIRTIEDLKAQAKMPVEVSLGIRADIERAIDLHYRSSSAIQKQVSQFEPVALEKKKDLRSVGSKTPVSKALDLLISQAVKDRASDIHIEPQEDRLRIRYRIDGILHDSVSLPVSIHSALVSRVKILAEMDISEQRRPQDGQFSITVDGQEIDIRTAIMETPHGERITLRILDKSLALFTLAELGFQPEVLKKYQAMLKNPYGMLLVGGPTGSGKTTTLYASINNLDRNESNIITIEDPIEYTFTDINQTQVNNKAGITFASGLRAIMRHDPDVILVGEIRDKETVTIATQSALTGHLVLSSIHANDAVGVLFRLMDLDLDPSTISSTLIGVVAQRMVRCICPNCCIPYQPSEEEMGILASEPDMDISGFFQGAGCNLCANSGFRGRTGIFELMIISNDIRKLLRDGAGNIEIREQAIADGMLTMKQDGLLKVKQGVTSLSEVKRCVFSIT